jgi:hypothetical protein
MGSLGANTDSAQQHAAVGALALRRKHHRYRKCSTVGVSALAANTTASTIMQQSERGALDD